MELTVGLLRRGSSVKLIDGAPSSLTTTATGATTLTLNWTNGSTNEDSIKVERSANGITGWSVIASLAAGVATVGDTGLTEETTYYYRVRALKGTIYSDYCDVVTGKTFCAEIAVYIAGLTTPLSLAQKQRINTLVNSIKTGMSIASLSSAFDIMYLLAGETAESALRNMVANANHAAVNAAPTFTALEGYNNDGVTLYQVVIANWNPSTEGVRYIQDSASLGIYSRSDSQGHPSIGIAKGDNTLNTSMNPRNVSNQFWALINVNGTNQYGNVGACTDSRGMFIGSRTANNLITGYRNGSSVGTSSDASVAPPNADLWILGWTRDGVAAYTSTRQISFVFAGKGLSGAEVTVITNSIEAYMDANGKGMIA